MNQEQWQQLVQVVNGETLNAIPTAFIIDSPWLPGWYGISTLDYYTSDTLWFEANKKVIETFPQTIFLPGFWSEYGMCTEPSAFGAKCQWRTDSLPHADKIMTSLGEVASLKKPNVKTDGLLPFMINRLKHKQGDIEAMGHSIKFAIARGPLNIASFLMGTTELMMGMMTEPDKCHKLVGLITDFLVDWVGCQIENFPSIEGILLLDDIIGFIGDRECQDYVVPYFKKIYDAFGAKVNFLHNDAAGLVSAPYLADMGVNLFNYSFEHSIKQMKELTGGKVTLLGNIPPRDVLAAGSPDDVQQAVEQAVADVEDRNRIILSCGGGMPQAVPTENIEAFIAATASL